MILVIGGTKEGEKVTRLLRDKSFNQSVTSDFKTSYGENVSKGIIFLPSSLNCPMTTHLIKKYKIKVLIDATPVYSKGASLKAMSTCRMTGVRYIRFESPAVCLKESKMVYIAKGFEEASEKAVSLGRTIFLNIGNNNINIFTKSSAEKNGRIVVRVSEQGALTHSLKFGVKRHDILFIDGVFSEYFNKAIIREYNISVFVTRDLGEQCGIAEEIKAAKSEKIPVVFIERPRLNYKELITDYDKLLQRNLLD